MRKILLLFPICLFSSLTSFSPLYAQNIPQPNMGIDCYGTIEAWKSDPSLRSFMSTHNCECPSPNARPVCEPISSGSSPSIQTPFVPSGRLSPSQQMTLQIMQSIFQPLFNAIFQDIFSPPNTSGQQEEARRQQEEMKRQAFEAWQRSKKELEAERLRQEAQRREAGQQILAQSRISEDLKLEPSLFGSTQVKLDTISISALSRYPAPSNEIDRARCAAYFSDLAKNTKDAEGAKFLSLQAEKVMRGEPLDYPCQIEKTTKTQMTQESFAKKEEVEAFINTYQAKILEFDDILTKVNEIRKQVVSAEDKLKEADVKIKELQTRSTTSSNQEEKAKLDDLLAQAFALKEEAERELKTAKENEQKLLEMAKQKADEIKAINEQISTFGMKND